MTHLIPEFHKNLPSCYNILDNDNRENVSLIISVLGEIAPKKSKLARSDLKTPKTKGV